MADFYRYIRTLQNIMKLVSQISHLDILVERVVLSDFQRKEGTVDNEEVQ